ncbi:MAG: hypothetical protein SNJ55_10420 [Chloroherpetonaceae bacterium]
MNFVKQNLTSGFTTKKKNKCEQIGLVVVHKKVLRQNKNAKNANASNNGRQKRTTNAQQPFAAIGADVVKSSAVLLSTFVLGWQ